MPYKQISYHYFTLKWISPQKPPEMGANFNEIAPSNASVVFRLLMQMQTNAKRKSGTFWLETFYDATF